MKLTPFFFKKAYLDSDKVLNRIKVKKMTEWIWVMLTVWIIILLIGQMKKDKNLQAIDAMIGIIFGVLYLSLSAMLDLALIVINLYLIYDALE